MAPKFHGRVWQEYIHKRVRPQFESFGHLVLTRVLPVFDSINEEAYELEQTRSLELRSSVDVPDDDGTLDEAISGCAFDEAMDYAMLLGTMRAATLNLYAAALYHLTEQHLIDLVMKIHDSDEPGRHELKEATAWFKKTLQLDITTLSHWPQICDLLHVANVVKHGEGKSAQVLHETRPDLFVHPTLRGRMKRSRTLRLDNTLFGQAFFVTKEDFVHYHESSVEFWTELADALPGLSR